MIEIKIDLKSDQAVKNRRVALKLRETAAFCGDNGFPGLALDLLAVARMVEDPAPPFRELTPMEKEK